MADKPQSGELFGIPYNFQKPSLGRMMSSYWQPDEGMLVEKPFGIGYTLNLANWRSWVVLAVASALFFDTNELRDLFELPCMANMEERLHEKKPVRKDLYNFARMVMWLPQYQDSSLDEIVADLKDVFSRWPWYDEQETEYQVRYEFSNTIDGDTPLPMSCDNDDMQRYCIGRDQCPYSIWGSLPFPDKMYNQVDEESAAYVEQF